MRTDDVNEGLVEALQTKRLPVKKLLLFVGLPLLLLFAIGGGYVYADSSLRASLSIKLKLEPISKEIDATIDSKAQTLVIGETSIPIQIVEDLVDGKKDAQTTGKDKVGESSSGTVTLYNRTSSEKTFPKDTKLTGAGGLVFSTTEDVKIASSSSGSDFSIQPGKAEVKVVATKIGPNYNVASGTEFTVANFDKISFIASNAQAFSGGSSSEIQVVSKTDLSNLESQLKKELLEKPTTQQQNTISLDLAEVKDKTTSHDLGDETTQLEMSMTIARKSATLSQDAMLEIIQVLFAEEIAKGSVDLTSVEVFAVDQSQKQIKDGTELRLAVRAKIQPQFAIDRLLPQIQGRTPDQVSTLLSTYKEIESHKLTRSPAVLPTLFGRLPKDASAITITIEK
ncbi:MAG: hypothetical protein A2378_03335 [Candidatus Pacebacteria bacterium RIFOXYB1_FULL_44_10]|nr:MAG: hypothetical protein A2378_03335 [Candidatus Pacebacteria bacterium RIFOXYB1_FULL_44_10]